MKKSFPTGRDRIRSAHAPELDSNAFIIKKGASFDAPFELCFRALACCFHFCYTSVFRIHHRQTFYVNIAYSNLLA